MRIGLFTDQYIHGISGLVTSISMLHDGLKEAGHECFIFTSFSKNITPGEPDVVNLPGLPYPLKGFTQYRFVPDPMKCLDLIKSYNLDIVHLHTEFSMANVAMTVCRELHLPMVYTLHTMYEHYLGYISPLVDRMWHDTFWKRLKKKYLVPIADRAAMVIVPTQKMYRLRSRYELKDNVTVIPTGVELDRFHTTDTLIQKAAALRQKMGLDGKFVYLYVGRLSAEKDIDNSLAAFKALDPSYNTVFVIVGGGPASQKLQQCAAKLGLSDRVIFTGPVPWSEVPVYYHMGDLFVSSSVTETQGLTFVETLASGLPIVAIDDECLSGLIKDGSAGCLCRNREEMTATMDLLYNDRERLAALTKNTVASVADFSKENYSSRVIALYKEVLGLP